MKVIMSKINDHKTITLKLDSSTWEDLRAVSKGKRRSLDQVVSLILQESNDLMQQANDLRRFAR